MSLSYVTGISASGKSAVLHELRARGEIAYGVDEDGYGLWVSRWSGEVETLPVGGDVDLHAWFRDHDWRLDVERIAALKERSDAQGERVFLCGVAAGDAEAWKHFDLVCALVVDEATIRRRISLREDAFGKEPRELEQILEWNEGFEETYRGFGAVIVDATLTLSEVVDAILAAAHHGGRN